MEITRALSEAFAVWAGVVGMIGVAIVWELSRLRKELTQMREMLNDHMVDVEHRLTTVEIRNGVRSQ